MSSVKVLIVEDNEGTAKVLALILKKLDHEVVAIANSSETALALFKEHSPDVVLMDINIQGDEDGIVTAAAMQKIKEVPIIYLTASSNEETIHRAMKTHPFGYIIKPCNDHKVAVALKLALCKSKFRQAFKESQKQNLNSIHTDRGDRNKAQKMISIYERNKDTDS